jgi:hypothetical protein
MLNPESVMNLFRHLFRAGLFQHLIKQTLKSLDPEINSGYGSGWQKRGFSEISLFFLKVFLSAINKWLLAPQNPAFSYQLTSEGWLLNRIAFTLRTRSSGTKGIDKKSSMPCSFKSLTNSGVSKADSTMIYKISNFTLLRRKPRLRAITHFDVQARVLRLWMNARGVPLEARYERSGTCSGGFRLPARSRFGEGRPFEACGGVMGFSPWGSTWSQTIVGG